ncbi:hypothetical protein AAY473_013343 [Plecturocebus cupreus]
MVKPYLYQKMQKLVVARACSPGYSGGCGGDLNLGGRGCNRVSPLLPMLQYNGTISAHCNLRLPEMGFFHVGQADLKLPISGDPLASASLSAGNRVSLLPRLEYSGAIMSHYAASTSWAQIILLPQLPDTWDYRHMLPWLIFGFFVEMTFHHAPRLVSSSWVHTALPPQPLKVLGLQA